MLQPTGSVYLDAPRPTQRVWVGEPPFHRSRRLFAGALTLIGIVALTAAAVLAGTRTLVHDRDMVVRTVETALDDPQIRSEFQNELITAIEQTLFGPELVEQLAIFGIDVEAEAARIAPLVLDDPSFRVALGELVVESHERILFEPSTAPLDVSGVSAAVVDVIEREIPAAARVIPANATLLQIPAEDIPDLSAPARILDRSLVILIAGGVMLVVAAGVHPRWHRVMAWTGRWLLTMAVISALLAVGLPMLGEHLTGYAAVETGIRSFSGRLLAPSAMFGVVGMGMVSVAAFIRRRELSRNSDRGIAVALGLDEPPVFAAAGVSPDMQLAHRGLVDADHPLTNI